MKKSITYYLTLLVIRLKGIKKNFSQDPINFRKIRRDDVKQPVGRFFKSYITQSFTISDTVITEVGTASGEDRLLIFIHGGAYISGPAQHHWDSLKKIAQNTKYKIWMCDYPKAPENSISIISENIDRVYQEAIKKFNTDKIAILGDSVGGALAAALTQRLITKNFDLPSKLILISPVMDASMTNPEIATIEPDDPMLSIKGVLSAKKLCAGNLSLKDQLISPLSASFEGFPSTQLFLAENDIMYPDGKLALEKMKAANVKTELVFGEKMPHIWPLLPVMKEAKLALNHIIQFLNNAQD